MKKKIIVLLVVLIFPFVVSAETEWHNRSSNYGDLSCYNDTKTVYKSVEYQNGVYQLNEMMDSFSIGSWNDDSLSKVYICGANGAEECTGVIAIYRDSHCTTKGGYPGHVGYYLSEGTTDLNSFFIGNDYTYKNGKYTMTDYEEIPISNYTHVNYLSNNFEGKYFCKNYKKSCQVMYEIGSASNTTFGEPLTQLFRLDEYYLIGDNYVQKDGKYYLINPQKVDLVREGGVTGYSCRSKEDNCNTLYRITVDSEYDGHDGRKTTYEELVIEQATIEKEVQIEETFDVSTFYKREELSKVFSTNPEIAEIKDGVLILYRVGTTDLIYEDDVTYKVIHLKVTDEALTGNPKTRNTTIITVILGLILITSMFLFQKKYSE